jgi:hypothetical protein
VAGIAALVEAGAADVPIDDDSDYVVGQPDDAGPAAASRAASREFRQVFGPAPRGMAMRWHDLS